MLEMTGVADLLREAALLYWLVAVILVRAGAGQFNEYRFTEDDIVLTQAMPITNRSQWQRNRSDQKRPQRPQLSRADVAYGGMVEAIHAMNRGKP